MNNKVNELRIAIRQLLAALPDKQTKSLKIAVEYALKALEQNPQ